MISLPEEAGEEVSHERRCRVLKVSCGLSGRPTTAYGKVLWPEQAMREAAAEL
jgi:hypothetical protein